MAEWLGPPKEPQPAPKPNSPLYNERHPTRYAWDDDVRDVVDKIFRNFNGVSCNSYIDHPEGWSARLGYNTARPSIDVWDIKGRGWPIDPKKGARIVQFLMNMPGEPHISWLLWWAEIWSRAAGGVWQPQQDDGTGLHYDHIHVTSMPRGWRP